MKKFLLMASLCMLCTSAMHAQIKIGGRTLNTEKLIKAASDATTALTLSDADVAAMSREAVEWMDENNPIADQTTEYGARLKRLTANVGKVNGMTFNFKVYHVLDVNAFACGDGSIRVFSSLMDIMDDDELMGIIGHEIGHVVNSDVKDAMKAAYLAQAAKGAISSTEGKLAKLTDSQLGDLVMALTDAQFSQKQEYAADDYGYKFCIDNGMSPYGMSNSLTKLVELSNGAKASSVQKMFSSHPDSEKRAARIKAVADAYVAQKK